MRKNLERTKFMQEKLNHAERLMAVIEWADMSVNVFARHIGLTRSENLYQIKKGNNGISQKTASMIVDKFPQVDLLWLLTGDGQMLSGEESSSAMKPFYNLGVEQHIRHVESLETNEKMILPSNIDFDIAMPYLGRAMNQSTPTNTILLLKKILPEMIIPGDECVIVTKKIVLLRIIRHQQKTNGTLQLRLMATNSETFGDVTLEMDEVEAAYVVKGKIITNI
ncbi:MAG: hypothetical protein SNF93_00480 [Rikenellaceae bacterium]